MAQTTPMFKTTIVIWSDGDPAGVEIDRLARDAIDGDSYCSKRELVIVDDPQSDPDWDGTDFFDRPDDY